MRAYFHKTKWSGLFEKRYGARIRRVSPGFWIIHVDFGSYSLQWEIVK